MPANVFGGSEPRLVNTVKNQDLLRQTEDQLNLKLLKDLEPHFRASVKSSWAEQRLKSFHKDVSSQATVIDMLLTMTNDPDQNTRKRGYNHLERILDSAKGNDQKERVIALLYGHARQRLSDLQFNPLTATDIYARLSDLELIVLQCGKSNTSFKANKQQRTARIDSVGLQAELKKRGLQTPDNGPEWKFSDVLVVVRLQRGMTARKLAKVESKPLSESIAKWKGPLGGVRPRNTEEAFNPSKRELQIRTKLTTISRQDRARDLVNQFGTFRTRSSTDALIAKTLLSMTADPDEQIVKAGYTHIETLLSKSDSTKTKLIAHMYNEICSSILRQTNDNSTTDNINALSPFALFLLKGVSPTGIVKEKGGVDIDVSRSLDSASKRWLAKNNKTLNKRLHEGESTFDDLRAVVAARLRQANKFISRSPLYPLPSSESNEVSRNVDERKAIQTHRLVSERIDRDLEKWRNAPEKTPLKPLGSRVFGEREDCSADKGFVTAIIDASASRDPARSKYGFASLTELLREEMTRDRAMQLILGDTYERIARIKRELHTSNSELRFDKNPDGKIELEVLRRVPLVGLMAIHYERPELLTPTKMKEILKERPKDIDKAFLLDTSIHKRFEQDNVGGVDTIFKLFELCAHRGGVVKSELKNRRNRDYALQVAPKYTVRVDDGKSRKRERDISHSISVERGTGNSNNNGIAPYTANVKLDPLLKNAPENGSNRNIISTQKSNDQVQIEKLNNTTIISKEALQRKTTNNPKFRSMGSGGPVEVVNQQKGEQVRKGGRLNVSTDNRGPLKSIEVTKEEKKKILNDEISKNLYNARLTQTIGNEIKLSIIESADGDSDDGSSYVNNAFNVKMSKERINKNNNTISNNINIPQDIDVNKYRIKIYDESDTGYENSDIDEDDFIKSLPELPQSSKSNESNEYEFPFENIDNPNWDSKSSHLIGMNNRRELIRNEIDNRSIKSDNYYANPSTNVINNLQVIESKENEVNFDDIEEVNLYTGSVPLVGNMNNIGKQPFENGSEFDVNDLEQGVENNVYDEEVDQLVKQMNDMDNGIDNIKLEDLKINFIGNQLNLDNNINEIHTNSPSSKSLASEMQNIEDLTNSQLDDISQPDMEIVNGEKITGNDIALLMNAIANNELINTSVPQVSNELSKPDDMNTQQESGTVPPETGPLVTNTELAEQDSKPQTDKDTTTDTNTNTTTVPLPQTTTQTTTETTTDPAPKTS